MGSVLTEAHVMLYQNTTTHAIAQLLCARIDSKGRVIVTINDGYHDYSFPLRFLNKRWKQIA